MDLREIECFLAVARNLHFRRAAEELHLSPATVSEAVRRLETEIGAPLFDRTTRQVGLTDLGRSFQPDAIAAYQTVTDAFERGRELAAQRTSVIRVGYTHDATDRLVAAAARVNRALPGVSVHLERSNSVTQLERLNRRQLDAALVWGAPQDGSLKSEPIGKSHLLAITPSEHPLAELDSTTMKEVAACPLVMWPRAISPLTYDTTVKALTGTGVHWHISAEADTGPNVVSHVLAGRGIGLLSDAAAGRAAEWGIAAVMIADSPTTEQLVVWRDDHEPDGLDLLIAELRHRPDPKA